MPINQMNQQPNLALDQTGKRQKGTGFTNINKLLGANQGAGQQIGQAIGQNIGNQAGKFQTNLTQEQQKFGEEKQKNTFGDTDAAKVKAGISNVFSATPGVQQGNAANAEDFQKYLAGQYSGPQGLTNSGQLQQQAGNINQLGQATQSQSGREGLLRQMIGKGQYTQGQQRMDSALLNQGGNQALKQVRQQTGQVGNLLGQAETDAQQQVKAAQEQNKRFAENTLNQFNEAGQRVDNETRNAYEQNKADAERLTQKRMEQQRKAVGLKEQMDKAVTEGKSLEDLVRSGVINEQNFDLVGLKEDSVLGDYNLGKMAESFKGLTDNVAPIQYGDRFASGEAARLLALQNLSGNRMKVPGGYTTDALQKMQQQTGETELQRLKSGSLKDPSFYTERADVNKGTATGERKRLEKERETTASGVKGWSDKEKTYSDMLSAINNPFAEKPTYDKSKIITDLMKEKPGIFGTGVNAGMGITDEDLKSVLTGLKATASSERSNQEKIHNEDKARLANEGQFKTLKDLLRGNKPNLSNRGLTGKLN